MLFAFSLNKALAINFLSSILEQYLKSLDSSLCLLWVGNLGNVYLYQHHMEQFRRYFCNSPQNILWKSTQATSWRFQRNRKLGVNHVVHVSLLHKMEPHTLFSNLDPLWFTVSLPVLGCTTVGVFVSVCVPEYNHGSIPWAMIKSSGSTGVGPS